MNFQTVQTTQNESISSEQKGVAKKIASLKILQHESNSSEQKEESGKTDTHEFIEIKPETIHKIPINEDKGIYKMSCKLTDDEFIEIIYNNKLNTFNAPKLVKSLGDKTRNQFKDWLKGNNITEYIDYLSHHLFINQNPKLYDDEEEFKKNRVIYVDESGDKILSGTWLNFELLPEILRFSSNKYRFLANHYENMLLIHLTNQNISFEQATSKLQRKLLWQMEMLNEIDTIPNPGEKGKAMERYTTTLLREVFINSEEQNMKNEENVKLVSNQPHTCDIQIINEKILVEVKAVKKDLTANDVKFINDILAHPTTINAGIYVNFFDDSIKTRIEFNPLRFYINKYDFDDKMLILIKNTIDFYERKLLDTRETNRQFNSIAKIKEIEQAAIDYFYIDFKRILMGIMARAKLDPDLKDLPIHSSDITNPEKLNKDVAVAQSIKEIEESLKEFIGKNYNKFNTEYFTLQAKNDAVEYLKSKGLPNPGVQKIADIFNTYLKTDRSKLSGSKKLVYVFKPEQLPSFDEYKDNVDTSNKEEPDIDELEPPTIEEISEVFFNKPENIQAINNEQGIKQDVLAARFRNFIKTDYQEKYKLNPSKYTIDFQKQALDRCVQFGKDKKHHKYLSKESPKAQEYIQTLQQMIKDEYEKDNKLTYTKFNNVYKSKINADDRLTKPIILKELNAVINSEK